MTPVLEKGVVSTEVAEHFGLLRTDSHLRVPEYYEVLVISYTLLVLQNLVHVPVPDADQHPEPLLASSRVELFLRVGSHVLPVYGLDDQHDVRVPIDIFMRVHFVQEVKTVKKNGLPEGSQEVSQSCDQVLPVFGGGLIENGAEGEEMGV